MKHVRCRPACVERRLRDSAGSRQCALQSVEVDKVQASTFECRQIWSGFGAC